MCLCVSLHMHVSLYIHQIDILSSTDKLFRCISIHPCGETHEMILDGIETRLTLREPDNIPHRHKQSQRKRMNFNAYFLIFPLFTFTLTATGMLCSLEDLYKWQALIPSWKFLTLPKGSIYIVIHRQTVSLYHNSSEWLDTWDGSSWDRNSANFTLIW